MFYILFSKRRPGRKDERIKPGTHHAAQDEQREKEPGLVILWITQTPQGSAVSAFPQI